MSRSKTFVMVIGALGLLAETAFAQSTDPSAPMTREKIQEYFRLSNHNDPRQYDYFVDDVDMEGGALKGRAAFRARTEQMRRDAAITMTPGLIAIDDSQDMMAVEMTIHLVALRDGVELGDQPQPVHKGDAVTRQQTFFFALRDGRITSLTVGGGERVRQKADLAAARAEAPTAAQLAEPMPASINERLMTHQKYLDYAMLFSRFDPRFLQYYDPDVVFATAPAPQPLHGPKAIHDLYVPIRRNLDEHITAPIIVVDNSHDVMFVQLRNRMVATRGDVDLPSGVLKMGEEMIGNGVIVYSLKNGKISYIRAAASGSRFEPAAR